MYTSEDIRNIGFQKAGFSGYKSVDVDDFIENVANDFETLENNNRDLITKIQVLADHIEKYRGNEDAVKEAIINAQITADNVLKDAQQKANETLEQANAKAKLIIEEASTNANKLNSDAQKTSKEIIDVANAKSNEIVSDAESKAILLKNDADKKVEIQKEVYKKLKSVVGTFRSELISEFKQHIELLYFVSDSEKFLNEVVSQDTTNEEFNEKLLEKEISVEHEAFEEEEEPQLKLSDFESPEANEIEEIDSEMTANK